jgi:YtcA family
MTSRRWQLRSCLGVALAVACAGCQRAPSIDVIGSFLPVWMLCLTVAVALSFLVRYFLVRYHAESEIGPLALFYPCVVILFTCTLWLVFFR